MLRESFASAEDDMAARALREAQVDAERMLLGHARRRWPPTATCWQPSERARSSALLASCARLRARATIARAIERALEALAKAPRPSPPSG